MSQASNEPDLARMAAQIETLRRKKAALALAHGGVLAPASALIPAWRPAHSVVCFSSSVNL